MNHFVRLLCRAWTLAALSVVLNGCGGGSSSANPPVIDSHPSSTSVRDGGTAVFAVGATGSAPLNFQWKRNGSAIAGANATSYTLAAASLADDGAAFSVTVSNANGSVTSKEALLRVTPAPARIVNQPVSSTIDDGSSASFTVAAEGSPPLRYQWQRDGKPIAEATSANYSTANLTLADDQSKYSVTVSNGAGSDTSQSAVVTVRALPPVFVKDLTSLKVSDGVRTALGPVVKGSAPLTYQWKRNGIAIPGATGASYDFVPQLSDSGAQYTLVVTNALGSATSAVATLTVDPNAPSFVLEPQSVTVTTGGTFTLNAQATGTGPIAYQWQRSDDGGLTWTNIAGATDRNHVIGSATLAWANSKVRVTATNIVSSVASRFATVAVVPNVHIVAGAAGGAGFRDGVAAEARFSSPTDLAIHSDGTIYVADIGNASIRRISPQGWVSTIAIHGSSMVASALALDQAGTLYASSGRSVVRVNADGTLTTIAGDEYTGGSSDGLGAAAKFSWIRSLAVDRSGHIWVADQGSATVRRIAPDGRVTTVAGATGQWSQLDGKGSSARFLSMGSIAVDESATAYLIDGQTVRTIRTDGTVTRFAGTYGAAGAMDGDRLTMAQFSNPTGVALDPSGNVYVTEMYTIRRIDTAGACVTVAGGIWDLRAMERDGTGPSAVLKTPYGIAYSPSRNAMVFVEALGNTVRSVSYSGTVATLAGTPQAIGYVDGYYATSRIFQPTQMVRSPSGNLYFIDSGNGYIRRITPQGGVATVSKFMFSSPYGIAIDRLENIYVADISYHVVFKISPGGAVTIVGGISGVPGLNDGPVASARFNYPMGLAVDSVGNIFVSEWMDGVIRKIGVDGNVTTFAGVPGKCGSANNVFCGPSALAMQADGSLLVLESQIIRRVAKDGTVSTVAGALNSPGSVDGPAARFAMAVALAVDSQGNIYVADYSNQSIRKLAPSGYTTTVIGTPGGKVLSPGINGTINAPTGVAVDAAGRVYFSSESAIVAD